MLVERTLRRLRHLLGATGAWIVLVNLALAAGRQEVEPPATKEYVLPWALVILCTALGLIVVCRPGKRTDKARVKTEE